MTDMRDDPPSPPRRARWKQNPDAVRANILRVAEEVFAKNGLSGARVDEIAAKTETSKRMIYYYFGDKEGLYRRTLEEAYRKVRSGENELDLDHLPPVVALRRLVEFTFDHHRRHPDFIRLVMIENVHNAQFLAGSDVIRDLNRDAISRIERVIARGQREGAIRKDADPLVVHWQISALSFFNVSNRPTFSQIFGDRIVREDGQAALRAHAVTSVLCSILTDPASDSARG